MDEHTHTHTQSSFSCWPWLLSPTQRNPEMDPYDEHWVKTHAYSQMYTQEVMCCQIHAATRKLFVWIIVVFWKGDHVAVVWRLLFDFVVLLSLSPRTHWCRYSNNPRLWRSPVNCTTLWCQASEGHTYRFTHTHTHTVRNKHAKFLMIIAMFCSCYWFTIDGLIQDLIHFQVIGGGKMAAASVAGCGSMMSLWKIRRNNF